MSVERNCPVCQSVLVIDQKTGEILMHREVKKGPVLDIAEAAQALKEDAKKREDMFQKNLESEKNRGDILKKKFDEAFKRAQENPDEPPPQRDIDLD